MISSLLFACALLAQAPATGIVSDGLSRAVMADAYGRVTPAICVLTYTIEITNTSTGESSKRDRDALGLIVSRDGLVMTHGHMSIENREPFNIRAKIGEGKKQKEYEAVLLKKPEDINVCFLRIKDAGPFPFVTFGNADAPRLAEPVFAIGILADIFDYARSIQTRRVGAILREPRDTYCIDEPITFGFVGGPVMNAQGALAGVLGFELASNEGGEIYTRSGHPLIFQSSIFRKYIDNPPGEEELNEEADDAYFGVFTQPLTDDLSEYWGLKEVNGIVVSTVIQGSPAESAGIQMGDIITSFNGNPVSSKVDQDVIGFTKMVRESPIGQTMTVSLLRGGKSVDVTLTLTLRPKSAADAEEFEDAVTGLTVRELTHDVRLRLNLPQDVSGVLVFSVKSGSPANQASLRRGFLIVSVGETPVANLDDFRKAMTAVSEAKPAEVTLLCRVGANTAFFRLQPRWTQ